MHKVAADNAGVTIRYGLMPPEEVILGKSAAMSEVRHKLDKLACTDLPVLIRGEAGSGKEILARLIHRKYPGETTPFHKVVPTGQDGWRKSDTFVVSRDRTNGNGHQHQSALGRLACVGSLFFEEIAELNFASQRKLTHLLHDDRLHDNGVSEYSSPLLRIICSTKHDIEREMRKGSFREDLFYSVNAFSVCLPPLRSRREDIPGLVLYFWECYGQEFGSDTAEPSLQLVEALQAHDWPGNIRELANAMKRYVLLGSDKKIIDDLAGQSMARKARATIDVSSGEIARQEGPAIERNTILQTLRESQWDRKRAARVLNISYRSLLYKIKEAGLPSFQVLAKRERQS